MKSKEIRDLTLEEMAAKVNELKAKHFTLRFQKSIGQLENDRMLGNVKRDIARIKTVMREVELKK